MNTSIFQSEANRLACKTQNDMRAICGMGRIPGTPVTIPAPPANVFLPPLTELEKARMMALMSLYGRDAFPGSEQEKELLKLIQRHVANGGTDPRAAYHEPEPGPGNNGASFATHSIDNFTDLANFLKASGIILLGFSLNPSFLIPANIIVLASFIYATRKLIFKFSQPHRNKL